MELALDLILLVVTVVAVGGVARRWNLPGPLLLVAVGLAASTLPRFKGFELDPDLVLVGLLPPLLYAAAVRTSLLDVRSNFGSIAALSVGLVIATTVAVGFLVSWLLPVPMAAAFALGAVVAPPDAVAASAIARRVGLPRRLVTILEGESLLNDATALVCLTAAIAGITGHVTVGSVAGTFVLSVVGGTGVGVGVALLVGRVRLAVDDTLTDASLTLITPFLAYLLAEEIHASGVLAVVVAGLLLGHKATFIQSAPSRLFERTNWRMIEFLLENTVFLLIGLQVRPILAAVGNSELGPGMIAVAAIATLVTGIAVRMGWFLIVRSVLIRRGAAPSGAALAVLSWAGTRGVVTLAAAFVLPPETPHREVLVLLALVVTAGTLVLQGSTLPLVIRRLGLVGPDRAEDALAAASVYQQAARAGRVRLDELAGDESAQVVDRLRTRSIERADALWERLGPTGETPSHAFARLRREMLRAERAEVLAIRDAGTVPHEVLQQVLAALDVEESVIEMADRDGTEERQEALRAPTAGDDGCVHLVAAGSLDPPARTPHACEECLRDGTEWVHLRKCVTCGHVGCCDSSVGRHAEGHHRETGHPVMVSHEQGEAWRWCYVDELLG